MNYECMHHDVMIPNPLLSIPKRPLSLEGSFWATSSLGSTMFFVWNTINIVPWFATTNTTPMLVVVQGRGRSWNRDPFWKGGIEGKRVSNSAFFMVVVTLVVMDDLQVLNSGRCSICYGHVGDKQKDQHEKRDKGHQEFRSHDRRHVFWVANLLMQMLGFSLVFIDQSTWDALKIVAV